MKNAKNNKYQNLIDAGLFALGTMISAKNENYGPAIYFMATALKSNGSDCTYLPGLIAKHKPKKTKP